MIRHNNIHRLILEGPLELRGNNWRKAKYGVDEKYQTLDGNEIICEIGSVVYSPLHRLPTDESRSWRATYRGLNPGPSIIKA